MIDAAGGGLGRAARADLARRAGCARICIQIEAMVTSHVDAGRDGTVRCLVGQALHSGCCAARAGVARFALKLALAHVII